MSLFKRKTVISVSSVIYPLGEDPDKVPDIVKAAVVTASIQKTPVSRAIQASILDGIGVKIAQGYSYASRSYYAGMPNALPSTFLSKDDPTLELLCEEHIKYLFPGQKGDVVSTTVLYGNDYETVVRGLIFSEYHYDFYEDKVFTPSGSIQLNASLELGPPIESVDHPDEVGYHLKFTNPDMSVVEIDEWYDADLFEAARIVAQRIFMEYTLNAGPHQSRSYIFGGSDARLNIFLRNLKTPISGTFPAIVLKRDNVYLDSDAFANEAWRTSAAYQTTKTYARRMDINVDDMLDKIRDNENADDIDFAFIQPGTLINATNKPLVKYHFNYFNRLRLNMPDSKTPFDAWVATYAYPAHSNVPRNQAENCPAQSMLLADPENPDSSVNIEISWRYISYEEKSGVIDEYEVECGAEETLSARYTTRVSSSVDYDVTKLYFRKALSPTTYAEICVCGLNHENYVYKGKSVQSAIWDAFNDPDGDYGTGFIIPLDYAIFITLTPRERVQLGQEAFHIIFNCYVAKKKKWYQTGIFKVVLAIISIVVIYFTWGAATPWVTGLYTTLTVTLGLTAIAAAIVVAAVLVTVFVGISFVAKEAGQWAAEHWGPGWGALVQIGTAILLSYGISFIPNMPAFAPTTLVGQVAFAGSYLLMGMSAYTQYQYAEFSDVQEAWLDYVNQPNDPLEQVTDLLEEMFPDLSVAQKAILPHTESLDEFLGRTLTTTDGLTGRLLMPITDMAQLTLTPRLI